MQSRRLSAVEALVSTALGYFISVAVTMIVLPAFGHDVSVRASFGISAVFTAVSVARSYLIRRLFERILHG